MAWKYQVDYECDPYNNIRDGGGFDDITSPTWGYMLGATGIDVSPSDGLWKLTVNVMVPDQMITLGTETFFQIIQFSMAGGDPVLAQQLFDICTRQLSIGEIRASTMDQTQCGFQPIRPAKYHIFQQVRPPVSELASGTWRDCVPTFTGIASSMDLSKSAMASQPVGQELQKSFQLILDEAAGDFGCTPPVD